MNLNLNEAGSTLTGDYNGDGTVDAADYTVWRDDQGASLGGNAAYDNWVNNFGDSLPAFAVPEPGTMLLAAMGVLAAMGTEGRAARVSDKPGKR